jgi:hypothetical protein
MSLFFRMSDMIYKILDFIALIFMLPQCTNICIFKVPSCMGVKDSSLFHFFPFSHLTHFH